MQTDSNLTFIRAKIIQLRSAIMYNGSQDLIRIPNNIVKAIEVDEEGQLWLAAKKPVACELHEFERTFPARLHFYRKGVLFYVEASGKATIMNSAYNDEDGNDLLLKMNLQEVEYTEPATRKEKGLLEKLALQAYTWLCRKLAFPHESHSVFPKVQRY
jgi:hypothetical protein